MISSTLLAQLQLHQYCPSLSYQLKVSTASLFFPFSSFSSLSRLDGGGKLVSVFLHTISNGCCLAKKYLYLPVPNVVHLRMMHNLKLRLLLFSSDRLIISDALAILAQ